MLLSTVAGMQTGTSRPYLPRASIRFRPPTCLEISVSLLLAPPMVPEIWQVALPTVGYATASCACTHTIEGTPARLYTCLASVNRSRNNANVLATPGCPWWQCIRASRSDTRQLGIASTDVRLTNVALRSISSHRRLSSSIRYLLTTSFVKPLAPAISLWPNNAA